jgi:hypothetical protein
MLGVANWIGTELFLPKIVEDELEGQFVRAVDKAYDKLRADVKTLEKLGRYVLDLDIKGSRLEEIEVRQGFRRRSDALKEQFKISSVSIHDVGLETLLGMAINREMPFEEIELNSGRRIVTGLQDTAILFSIAKHMQTAGKEDRCAFLSNDGVFHRTGVRDLLHEGGVKVEMFRKTSDLFDDLFEHIRTAIRTAWQAEMDQIKASLNAEKVKLTFPVLGLISPNDLGRDTGMHRLEIKAFKIVEFSQVTTELPGSEHMPPRAIEYTARSQSQRRRLQSPKWLQKLTIFTAL